MNDSIQARFEHGLGPDIKLEHRTPVLVACSGGGDSIALLHLTVRTLGRDGVYAATVNHNLRDVSSELDLVARHTAQLGVPHKVLDWQWDKTGNLQARARDARRSLLGAEATQIGADHILLGHTRDDQAETMLLRLARGSGVDGLAAMAARDGAILRPLLDLGRAELRDWLEGQGLDWAEDPSNTDPRFDRVRARSMMAELDRLGLTQDRLIATATLMAEERRVLVQAARDFAQAHSRTEGGDVVLDAAAFDAALPSLQTRLLAGIVQWFSGAPYKPRAADITAWRDRMAGGKPTPLGGVLAARGGAGSLRFYREPAALAAPMPLGNKPAALIWDNRWIISHTGSHTSNHTGSHIGPLGAGMFDFDNWRDAGLPRASVETSPAIWQENRCIAALCLDPPDGWSVDVADWSKSL